MCLGWQELWCKNRLAFVGLLNRSVSSLFSLVLCTVMSKKSIEMLDIQWVNLID